MSDRFPIPADFFGLDDARHAANETRAYAQGLEPCVLCGRGVKDGRGWVVCVVDGGASLLPVADYDQDREDHDPAYVGWWVIGPECGKGIPAAFRYSRALQ